MAQRSGRFIHRPAGLPQEETDRVQDGQTDGRTAVLVELKTENDEKCQEKNLIGLCGPIDGVCKKTFEG